MYSIYFLQENLKRQLCRITVINVKFVVKKLIIQYLLMDDAIIVVNRACKKCSNKFARDEEVRLVNSGTAAQSGPT